MLEKHGESGKPYTLAGSHASQATICPGPGFLLYTPLAPFLSPGHPDGTRLTLAF